MQYLDRNQTVRLQKEYLRTQNPQLIERLYENLLSAGRKVQRDHPEVNQDPEAVVDIAGSVILRFLNKKEVVVKAPMSYMKSALYFSNKTMWHDSLDEEGIEFPSPTVRSYDEYISNLFDDLNIKETTELGELVRETLILRLDWKRIAKRLPPDFCKQYIEKMEEVRKYVKENLPSPRVY